MRTLGIRWPKRHTSYVYGAVQSTDELSGHDNLCFAIQSGQPFPCCEHHAVEGLCVPAAESAFHVAAKCKRSHLEFVWSLHIRPLLSWRVCGGRAAGFSDITAQPSPDVAGLWCTVHGVEKSAGSGCTERKLCAVQCDVQVLKENQFRTGLDVSSGRGLTSSMTGGKISSSKV